MPVFKPSLPTSQVRRRGAAVAGAVALVAAGLYATGSTSSTATAAAPDDRLLSALESAPDTLRTPFEKSNGATWTTLEQSQEFWRQLDESSARVEVDQIGSSVEGRPLQLVQVGAPAPESADDAADGSVLMYNCSIHGDEPSGREACLQLARDLASSQDPAVNRLLSKTTVLFLNSNPDGWVANTRENADGVDVNRDLMELATPEATAIATTIRDWQPDVLNDLHEYGPGEHYDTDLLHLWPRNRNVDPAVHRLAQRMNNDYSAPQVEAAGYTSGIYGLLVKDGEPFQQVAGDGQGRILRNYSGLQNIVGMLSETANEPLTEEEEADPALLNRRRVEVNYTSAVGSAVFVGENRSRIERQTAKAAERVSQKGAEQAGVVYFEGQDDMVPTAEDGADPSPMCAYDLDSGQLDTVQETLSAHGIAWEPTDSGARVSMAQADQPLIPLLLDERSEYRLTEAAPVDEC